MNRRSFLAMLGLAPAAAVLSGQGGPAHAAPKRYAEGGIVRPLGPTIVGEHGTETIIPLKRMTYSRMCNHPFKAVPCGYAGDRVTNARLADAGAVSLKGS